MHTWNKKSLEWGLTLSHLVCCLTTFHTPTLTFKGKQNCRILNLKVHNIKRNVAHLRAILLPPAFGHQKVSTVHTVRMHFIWESKYQKTLCHTQRSDKCNTNDRVSERTEEVLLQFQFTFSSKTGILGISMFTQKRFSNQDRCTILGNPLLWVHKNPLAKLKGDFKSPGSK